MASPGLGVRNIICDTGVAEADRLPVAAVMEILGLDRQQFYEWRDLGLLGPRKRRELLSRADARELAVLTELRRAIGGTKAAVAYLQIRAELVVRDLRDRTEIIWIDQDRWASLIGPPEQYMEAARRGRSVLVISVHEEVQRVLDAFDRDAAGRKQSKR